MKTPDHSNHILRAEAELVITDVGLHALDSFADFKNNAFQRLADKNLRGLNFLDHLFSFRGLH
jgi:hypothetical protein